MVTHLECQKGVVISCSNSSMPGGSTQQVLLELLIIFTVSAPPDFMTLVFFSDIVGKFCSCRSSQNSNADGRLHC